MSLESVGEYRFHKNIVTEIFIFRPLCRKIPAVSSKGLCFFFFFLGWLLFVTITVLHVHLQKLMFFSTSARGRSFHEGSVAPSHLRSTRTFKHFLRFDFCRQGLILELNQLMLIAQPVWPRK